MEDIQIQSCDGSSFRVSSQALLPLRNILPVFPAGSMTEGGRLQVLQLEEDAATVGAIIQALKPDPPVFLKSLPHALKCLRAAKKYGIPYTLFPLDEPSFQDRSDPAFGSASFAVCAMAWSTGQWALAEHAARFTHNISQEAMFQQANDIPGAFEALAVLMATRVERAHRIAAVVHVLPLDRLTCEVCRAAHRNTVSAFTSAVSIFFQKPYPDITTFFDHAQAPILANPALLVGCERRTCRHSVRSHRFSAAEMTAISDRLAKVPQTIRRSLLNMKVAIPPPLTATRSPA